MEATYVSGQHPQTDSNHETKECWRDGKPQFVLDRARVSISSPAREQASDATLELPPLWCLRLGMTTRAWEVWKTLHVTPHVAVCYFFSAVVGLQCAGIVILTGMTDFRALYLYVCALPMTGFVVHVICTDVAFWRYGLDVLDHKLYPPTLALWAALLLPCTMLGFLGPLDAVPFHNRFVFVCWNSLGTFFGAQKLASGATKGEHPAQPRTSIFRPFVRGTIRAVQLTDALTDLAVIRTLLEQKATGCWWFGEESNCQAWTWLTVSFAVLTFVKFGFVVSVTLSGGESSGQSRRMQRLVFAADVGVMVSEMGVACCTLLQIFSLRASGSHEGVDERQLNSQIALGIVSLISSCAGVGIMLMGGTAALRVMYTVWNTVRIFLPLARQSQGSTMHQNGGNQVVPVEWDGDDEILVGNEPGKLIKYQEVDTQ